MISIRAVNSHYIFADPDSAFCRIEGLDPDAVPDPWSKRSILFLTKFLCNRYIVMWIRVGCHVDPDPG